MINVAGPTHDGVDDVLFLLVCVQVEAEGGAAAVVDDANAGVQGSNR